MEGDEFENLGFDPREFFAMLRKSASVRAGAVIFGQAQIAYYDVLKEHMSEEQAYALLAHTTETVIRSLASCVGPLADVALRAATLAELFGSKEESNKEVPSDK